MTRYSITERRSRIRECLGQERSLRERDKAFNEYYQIYEKSWRLFSDVENALIELAPFSLGVITNVDKEHQSYKLERLGRRHCFDVVVTPACAGAPKPDLAIFQLAAAPAIKPGENCWYIGDNYSVDYNRAQTE